MANEIQGLRPDGTLPTAARAEVEQIVSESAGMGVPIFPTLAEAQAWEAANPGRVALTIEPPADPGAWEAAAPTFNVPGRSYTIPTDEGASYRVNGSSVSAGTYSAGIDAVTVSVTAVARPGYTLAGTTSWSQSWAEVPAMSVSELAGEDEAAHFVSFESGAVIDHGEHAADWAATDVTISGGVATFNGSSSVITAPASASQGLLGEVAAFTVLAEATPTVGGANAAVFAQGANEFTPSDATRRVHAQIRGTAVPAVGVAASAANSSPTGVRAAFAWRYSAEGLRLFRNGVQVGQSDGNHGGIDGVYGIMDLLRIGHSSIAKFTGTIGHVVIVREALPDARIMEYAHAAGVV